MDGEVYKDMEDHEEKTYNSSEEDEKGKNNEIANNYKHSTFVN